MAEHIRVEYDILEEFARKFGHQADLTETVYARLFQQMEELRSGSWIGVGADTFYDEMEVVVLPSVEKLYNALQESMYKFRQISDMFAEMEGDAASLFAQDYDISDILRTLGNSGAFMSSANFLGGEILDTLIEYGGIKLMGQLASMTTTQEGFESVLNFIESGKFATGVTLFKGVGGGLLDFAMGGEYTGDELLVQTTSGVVQAFLLPPQVGLVNSGVQIIGNLMAEGAITFAPELANGDPILAQQIEGTAGRLQDALDAADVDARIDGVVESVFEGDLNGVVNEGATFLWGVGGTIVEGGTLIGEVGTGIANRIADNTQIDETIGDAVDWAGDRANDVANFFGF